MPRTSVVLPLPSSPESVNTIPPQRPRARRAPASSVAVGSGRYSARSSIIGIVMTHGTTTPPRATSVRSSHLSDSDLQQLARNIEAWGRELGFSALGIADIELQAEEAR